MAERKLEEDIQAEDGERERDAQKTPFEQFDDLMTKLLAVPKEELDEKRTEYEREREEKRAG